MSVGGRSVNITFALIGLCLSLGAGGLACGGEGEDASRQEALEREFKESMTGVVLEGHYTLNGREGVREERYEIQEVTEMLGDYWLQGRFECDMFGQPFRGVAGPPVAGAAIPQHDVVRAPKDALGSRVVSQVLPHRCRRDAITDWWNVPAGISTA